MRTLLGFAGCLAFTFIFFGAAVMLGAILQVPQPGVVGVVGIIAYIFIVRLIWRAIVPKTSPLNKKLW